MKNYAYILLIFLYYCHTHNIAKPPPPHSLQLNNETSIQVTLECHRLFNTINSHPFVKLVLLIEQTGTYDIATVYGQLNYTYDTYLPPFAPDNSIAGVSIKNNATIHYFFVCVHYQSKLLVIQSAKVPNNSQQTEKLHFTPIQYIPLPSHYAIKTTVIIK